MPPFPWLTAPRPHVNSETPAEHAPTEQMPTPPPDFRRLYEEAEATLAQAMEKLVARPSFGVLLAQVSENMIALSKIASDSADLALSNLRIAGRSDVVRLERQLGRSEDKLETLLQELEALRDELADRNRRDDQAVNGAQMDAEPTS
jgi:hypothetical protein